MTAPLSKTRWSPSTMAGMRPLGFIFKNQLLGVNFVCLFVCFLYLGPWRAYSSFWMLVEMFIGLILYCRPSSSSVMDALMPFGVGQLYRVSGAMVEYRVVDTGTGIAASLEAAREPNIRESIEDTNATSK